MIRTARMESILKRMNRRSVIHFHNSLRLKRRALMITSAVVIFPGFVFYCLYDPLYPMDPVDIKNFVDFI
jgi:hypothetical protein